MLDLAWAVHTTANHRGRQGTFGENKMAKNKEGEGARDPSSVLPRPLTSLVPAPHLHTFRRGLLQYSEF